MDDDDTIAAQRSFRNRTPIAVALFVVGVILVAFLISSSDVEGELVLSTKGGAETTFIPDDCRSGAPRGFAGVELSGDVPGVVVRLLDDPMQGPRVAVEREHGGLVTYDRDACQTLDVEVEEGNTTTNDVRSLRGSARVQCEGVRGKVVFFGCH